MKSVNVIAAIIVFACGLGGMPSFTAESPQFDPFVAEMSPLLRAVDLKLNESRRVELSDGSTADVCLLAVDTKYDSVKGMISRSTVEVEVNGERATLVSGNYRLPVIIGGVQIDCPVTGDYRGEKVRNRNLWNIDADARLRLWPAGSPWIRPGTFTYPIRQRWMAAKTWFSNEPMGGNRKAGFYYHAGMDFGAMEGVADVLAAADAIVVVSGKQVLPGYEPLLQGTEDCRSLIRKRYDEVYLKDSRGWYYCYSHLKSIDPAIRPGVQVRQGQLLGLVGKEGSSGGWSHLHFDIRALQPSGRWGVQDSYAFLWQAYIDRYKPKVLAVARPMQWASTNEAVTLDASRSWAASGIKSYHWRLSDGRTADGPTVKIVYKHPGVYHEIVKVSDEDGRIDYDFAEVRVTDAATGKTASNVDANYFPTQYICPGDEIAFSCRCVRGASPSTDTWDFGDGSPPVTVQSNRDARKHAPFGYAVVFHKFRMPGDYIVTVRRSDGPNRTATRCLHVHVRPAEYWSVQCLAGPLFGTDCRTGRLLVI